MLQAVTVMFQLTDFIGDSNELAAADILVFVREVVQRFDSLRPLALQRLLDAFPTIKTMKWVVVVLFLSPAVDCACARSRQKG